MTRERERALALAVNVRETHSPGMARTKGWLSCSESNRRRSRVAVLNGLSAGMRSFAFSFLRIGALPTWRNSTTTSVSFDAMICLLS